MAKESEPQDPDHYVLAGALLRDFLTWLETRGDGLVLIPKEEDARERYQKRMIARFFKDLDG